MTLREDRKVLLRGGSSCFEEGVLKVEGGRLEMIYSQSHSKSMWR